MSKVTRQEILGAAIHLFNQSGYHAASMEDVAQALSIKKASLYHHFDSKEAILLAILENGMERLTIELEEIVASDQGTGRRYCQQPTQGRCFPTGRPRSGR